MQAENEPSQSEERDSEEYDAETQSNRFRDVLVILPTYNERASILEIVTEVLAQVPRADVLIIDDGSSDGTGRVAASLAASEPRVRVLHREGKLGLGTAYVLGFQEALERGYRYVAEMDADGSHLAAELPGLVDAIRGGASGQGRGCRDETPSPGLVIGSRWIPGGRIVGWPWYRRLISRTGTLVARLALRSRLRDITSGLRIFDTIWLERIDLNRISSQGYGFQVEVASLLERFDCPIAEVPITFVERADGHSKMTLGIVVEALLGVLRWGFDLRFRPRRLPQLRPAPRGSEGSRKE